jgi:hypothetical protein
MGVLAAAIVAGVSVCVAQEPTLDVVVDRLRSYLIDYETKVLQVAADEQYDQWVKRLPGYGGAVVSRRKLQSTFFLVRLPDGQAWHGLRDVSSVDGKAVTRPDRSMEELLRERAADAVERGLAMTRANAKYNIGGAYRTINVPLQTLELLHPQHRNQFQFTAAGQARMAGQQTWQVDFAEQKSPSIITDGFGGDILARGRVWVEPLTGAVLKTELRVGGPTSAFQYPALITVEYRRDKRLQLLLPYELEETYTFNIEVLHGHASYRNYRRFETSAKLLGPSD